MSATGVVDAPSRRWARPGLRPTLLVAAMVVVLVALSIALRDQATYDAPVDPRNPGPDGAQAVARVLADHGVRVTVARGQDALLGQAVDARTAVVVTDPDQLGASTLRRLRERARDAAALVLVGDGRVLAGLTRGRAGDPLSGSRTAGCDVPLARDLRSRAYRARPLRADGCFGDDGTALLVRRDREWLWASPASMTNRHVLDDDNAALALRLLGQQPRLVWYVADQADTDAADGTTLSALLPPWLVPSLWVLLAAAVALLLWRGRRLGPLVVEPLPVVVRAAEATHSRGRMYRRSRDRTHAAAALVAGTRRRLAQRLRLPRGHALADLVAAVAARSGRPAPEIHALLDAPPVPDDAALARLARELQQLEDDVDEQEHR